MELFLVSAGTLLLYYGYKMIKTNLKTVQSLSRKEKKANKKLYNKKVRKMSV